MIILSVMFATVFTACSHKRSEADAARKAEVLPADPTKYGTVKTISAESVTLSDENGNDITLALSSDLKAGIDAGCTFEPGDTIAYMAGGNGEMVSAVNLNNLYGLWLSESGDGNGIRIEKENVASTVGVADYTIRGWRMDKGRLMFANIPSDGSDYEEHEDIVGITVLNRDKFVFFFKGDTIVCNRQE